MDKKYEFRVDHEERAIFFGDWQIHRNGFLREMKDVLDVAKNSMDGFEGSRYDGTAFKSFNEKYGITPSNFKRVYNTLYRKVWIEPIEKWALQYAFSMGKKINLLLLNHIHNVKDDLIQMEKDGLDHLIPFRIYLDMTPAQMKRDAGKGVWKALCKNSRTRNKYIAHALRRPSGMTLPDAVAYINSLPSTVLKRGGMYGSSPDTLALCHIYKAKEVAHPNRDVMHDARIIRDTIRMAGMLDRKTNNKWSRRKWHEKHAEWTKEINAQKYSPKPIKWLTELPESLKRIEYEGLTASLLMSPLDIRTEGDTMRHCVGSYAGAVQDAKYVVYHIEGGNDSPPTTVGITHKWYGRSSWQIQQHYGKCNSRQDVTDVHKRLADEIVGRLNDLYEESACNTSAVC